MGPAVAEHDDQCQRRADRQRVDGRTLTLKYKDGEKKITVPANAPIVTYVPGDKGDIKPGAKVFIVAVKQADGTLHGRAWRIRRCKCAKVLGAPRRIISNNDLCEGAPRSGPRPLGLT